MNCRLLMERGQGSGVRGQVHADSDDSLFRALSPLAPRRSPFPRAFTLVELLVTIGIIVVLIGILVPVVSRVRQSAREADVKNQITVLAGAVQNYYNDFRAYPGPLSNQEIIDHAPNIAIGNVDNAKITQSENLVLGLLGGLAWNSGNLEFDWQRVGQGPSYLGSTPKKTNAYIDGANLTWNRPGYSPGATSGKFVDEVTEGLSPPDASDDSEIPEFVDRFSDPLPILYLRARTGAPGIVGDNDVLQYDRQEVLAYTGSKIGPGKKYPDHGLSDLGTMADAWNPNGPNNLIPYLKHPTLNPTGTTYQNGTPREKDRFILISAGADRVYGTSDDICSFGAVGE